MKENYLSKKGEKKMTRQEVWNLIDQHQEKLLELCSDMIRIPSVNPPGNVDEIVHYYRILRFFKNIII